MIVTIQQNMGTNYKIFRRVISVEEVKEKY